LRQPGARARLLAAAPAGLLAAAPADLLLRSPARSWSAPALSRRLAAASAGPLSRVPARCGACLQFLRIRERSPALSRELRPAYCSPDG